MLSLMVFAAAPAFADDVSGNGALRWGSGYMAFGVNGTYGKPMPQIGANTGVVIQGGFDHFENWTTKGVSGGLNFCFPSQNPDSKVKPCVHGMVGIENNSFTTYLMIHPGASVLIPLDDKKSLRLGGEIVRAFEDGAETEFRFFFGVQFALNR